MRLRDFQISFGGSGTPEQRALNWLAFPVYEAVRLTLKDLGLQAPFAKLVISIRDFAQVTESRRVVTALNICEVTEDAADANDVLAWDARRIVDLALSSVATVERSTHWDASPVREALIAAGNSDPPCDHELRRLTRTSRAGVRCSVRFRASVGKSQVVARIGHSGRWHENVLLTRAEPLFLEDEFPATTAAIIEQHYVIRARGKHVLARVPLRAPDPEPA